MYKLCKTEQSASRQRELEQGLLKLMLQMSYDEISISELCDRLQIPRKSFYRYFSSKDGALYALLDHTMMDFFNAGVSTAGLVPGTQIGDLDRYFAFWKEHRDLLDALLRNGLSGILVERAMALAIRERLMPGYMWDLEPDTQRLVMAFAVCGLLSMVLQWHAQGFKMQPAEMTQIAVSVLTKPLIQ